MHCDSFYPRAGPFWGPLLRLDRVVALQVGKERETVHKAGKCECLIAVSESPDQWITTTTTATKHSHGFLLDVLVQWMLPESMRTNYAVPYASAGILGAVMIDTLGEHIPPKRKTVRGIVRETPRSKKIAYLSNLAVARGAQGRGLGRHLLQEAESLAREWGCRSIALHVDVSNTPAVELYTSQGYRFVGRQSEWQRIMEGRSSALALMVRVLPRHDV